MANISDINWVKQVDPHKVYDVLVRFAGAYESKFARNNFVALWGDEDMHEYRFGGKLGFGGKIWRERRFFSGEGFVPDLEVSGDSDFCNEKAEAIVVATNKELVKLLIAAGLRPHAQVA